MSYTEANACQDCGRHPLHPQRFKCVDCEKWCYVCGTTENVQAAGHGYVCDSDACKDRHEEMKPETTDV